jgi:hypothetical protein
MHPEGTLHHMELMMSDHQPIMLETEHQEVIHSGNKTKKSKQNG